MQGALVSANRSRLLTPRAVILFFGVAKSYFQILAFSVGKQKEEIRASIDRTTATHTADRRSKADVSCAARCA